jgi:chromosomal replication initiation ATPase DnaA
MLTATTSYRASRPMPLTDAEVRLKELHKQIQDLNFRLDISLSQNKSQKTRIDDLEVHNTEYAKQVKDLLVYNDDLSKQVTRRQLLLNGAHEEITSLRRVIELNLEHPEFVVQYNCSGRPDGIVKVVMDHFGVTETQIQSGYGTDNIRECRMFICLMLKKFTKLTHKEIGEHAGYSDHTGSLYANKILTKRANECKSAAAEEKLITEKVMQSVK